MFDILEWCIVTHFFDIITSLKIVMKISRKTNEHFMKMKSKIGKFTYVMCPLHCFYPRIISFL